MAVKIVKTLLNNPLYYGLSAAPWSLVLAELLGAYTDLLAV